VLSHRTYTEIIRVTDETLQQVPIPQVVDRITVIHGYMQLLSFAPTQLEHYEAKLGKALQGLLRLVTQQGKTTLIHELQLLITQIDKELKA
jgi:hypothetical protein